MNTEARVRMTSVIAVMAAVVPLFVAAVYIRVCMSCVFRMLLSNYLRPATGGSDVSASLIIKSIGR